MKWKIFGFAVVLVLGLLLVTPVAAVKPATNNNLASAEVVPWHLSAAVMPVPPYGSLDIPGSDTASKLIVNQPNGNTEVTLTGVMNGLTPGKTYTVYLSKEYTPYVEYSNRGTDTMTSVIGTYDWLACGLYPHDLKITSQNADGTFTATGGYPAGTYPYTAPGQTPETITGQVVGNGITFTTTYAGPYNPGYSATVSGSINNDGSMSGTIPCEWHTTAGEATFYSGSTGWPGLFTTTVQPFTFTTDEFGSGSWHINLRDANFYGSDTYKLSVWINNGGTMLISNNFDVVVG